MIEEGLLDDAKSGFKKLSNAVTSAFKKVADNWAATISEKLNSMQNVPSEVLMVVDALKEGMKSTGESISLDETLKMAKSLGSENALQAAEEDLAGPIYANAKELKEMFDILSNDSYHRQRKNLHEVGVTAVLGIGLALIGGLPLLFKGLHKLAVYLGATRTAEILEKCEKFTHAVEKKFIDFVIPSKLSYAVYKFLAEKGFQVAGEKEVLTFDTYKGSSSEKKTEELIYKALLIYFAFQGLVGALKAGASLLGFVEGTATAVKGIELAKGFADVRKIVVSA